MKKILVPIDGSANSKRGLSKALEIAKKQEASIFALHIVVMSSSIAIGGARRPPKNEAEKKISKNIIAPAKKKCEQNGISFEFKIVYGADPGYDVVKFANKHGFEMIVMGARGLNSLKKIFLGSASDYVLKKAKIPVLIVK
ncbi:MAG: universal stress protein [Nitrosopumilus sp.]|nr:universal stress protein [Nitrosopumilus sp.]